MGNVSIASIASNAWALTKKHSPEILTGIGIAGMIFTVVKAIQATPKALTLIESKKEEEEVEKLSAIDTVKAAWKPYIPVVLTGTLSIACIVCANSINLKRNAALGAVCALTETALQDFKAKAIETIGDRKVGEIYDKIAEDKLEQDPVSNHEVIVTGTGKTLCYDVFAGRYFESDVNTMQRAMNEINREMLDDMYKSLNDFYYEIGISNTRIGDMVGWSIRDGHIDVRFSAKLAEDGVTPCLVPYYTIEPHHEFDRFT